jgi:hypothetical protein
MNSCEDRGTNWCDTYQIYCNQWEFGKCSCRQKDVCEYLINEDIYTETEDEDN